LSFLLFNLPHSEHCPSLFLIFPYPILVRIPYISLSNSCQDSLYSIIQFLSGFLIFPYPILVRIPYISLSNSCQDSLYFLIQFLSGFLIFPYPIFVRIPYISLSNSYNSYNLLHFLFNIQSEFTLFMMPLHFLIIIPKTFLSYSHYYPCNVFNHYLKLSLSNTYQILILSLPTSQ